LSKQLEPLVHNKTPQRHAATTFIFIFFFNMTPQISPYGGGHINYTPKTTPIPAPRSAATATVSDASSRRIKIYFIYVLFIH
jgi:hypothetical protein